MAEPEIRMLPLPVPPSGEFSDDPGLRSPPSLTSPSGAHGPAWPRLCHSRLTQSTCAAVLLGASHSCAMPSPLREHSAPSKPDTWGQTEPLVRSEPGGDGKWQRCWDVQVWKAASKAKGGINPYSYSNFNSPFGKTALRSEQFGLTWLMPYVKTWRPDGQINLETFNKLTAAKRRFPLWKWEPEYSEPSVIVHLELFRRSLKRREKEANEPFSPKAKWPGPRAHGNPAEITSFLTCENVSSLSSAFMSGIPSFITH